MILSGNNLRLTADSFIHFRSLGLLDLSHCSLKKLPEDVFAFQFNLKSLDLSSNELTRLPSGRFEHLHNLKMLKLDNNPLDRIDSGSFEGLSSLPSLSLRNMNFRTLVSGSFRGMISLVELDISSSHIVHLEPGVFDGLKALSFLNISSNEIVLNPGQAIVFSNVSLTFLESDDYTFCCLAQLLGGKEHCLPEKGAFSSCEDLISKTTQRLFLWLMGCVALFGNALVFIWWSLRGEERVSGYLVKYLSIADFLMGIYMISIASVDTYYRGRYIDYATWWKESGWCAFLGALATISSEASVFTLLAITADRLISIVWPFSPLKFTIQRARYALLAIWILAAVIAIVPFIPISYFDGDFYSRSGMCISLHITEEVTPGWEYSVAVFHGLNLLSFMLIFLGYACMHRTIKRGMLNKKREATVTRRMALIVFTDFCCWVPINIMGT